MSDRIEAGKELEFRFSPGLRSFTIILMAVGLLLIAAQLFFPWHKPGHEPGPSPASVPTSSLEQKAPIGSVGEGKAAESSSAKEKEKSEKNEHHAGNPRLFLSLHLALLLALPLALGGLYFVAFNHVSGSIWNITIRRLAEHSVYYLPIVFILMLVVFYGAGDVFHHWVHAPKDDKLIALKSAWLNLSAFIGRNILCFALWLVFGLLFIKKSLAQDKDGEVKRTRSLAKYSAAFLVIFALTYSSNSWDLSMSLEPHWFSTLWALYTFSGLALTIFAALVLWVWYLKKQGYYGASFNENHLHDLSKYIWGHSIFWAYMAVSQYMLIWYAAIPEETAFYRTRVDKGWIYVSFALVFLRFVFPFLLLLKRESKRKFGYMASIAVLILVGQVWDMYWIAYPTLAHGELVLLSWQELGPLAFVIGSYIFVMARSLEKHSLIPRKDPRLEACLHFHQ